MKKKFLFIGLLVALVFVSRVHAEATDRTTEFVTKASISNDFEIQSSKLALEKSGREDVKEFAQRMIDDHTKAGNDLKVALTSASKTPSIVIPKELDQKHQDIMDDLMEADEGREFDRAYISAQHDAHDEAVDLFREYSKKGDDKALKKFARETLPTLEKHQQHVKGLK